MEMKLHRCSGFFRPDVYIYCHNHRGHSIRIVLAQQLPLASCVGLESSSSVYYNNIFCDKRRPRKFRANARARTHSAQSARFVAIALIQAARNANAKRADTDVGRGMQHACGHSKRGERIASHRTHRIGQTHRRAR